MTSNGGGSDREASRDRGQSVSINYTLSLIIVALLISGLFIAMSGFLESEQERATRSEFDVLGNRIAADIATTDRLARAAENDPLVNVTTRIPAAVAGSEYSVLITSSGGPPYTVEIQFTASDVSIRRNVSVKTHYAVNTSRFSGGRYEVSYNGERFEVTDA